MQVRPEPGLLHILLLPLLKLRPVFGLEGTLILKPG